MLTLDMKQYDCPFILTSDELEVSYFGTYWDFDRNKFIVRVYILAKDPAELQNSLDALCNQPKLHKIDVLSKGGNFAYIKAEMDYTSAMNTIKRNCGYITGPFHIRNGHELWQLGFDTKKNLDATLSELDKDNEFHIKNYSKLSMEDFSMIINHLSTLANLIRAIGGMSQTEKLVLKTAVEHGFYENPKRINTTLLARLLRTSKAGVSKNLRRAEKKILPYIVKIINNISRY